MTRTCDEWLVRIRRRKRSWNLVKAAWGRECDEAEVGKEKKRSVKLTKNVSISSYGRNKMDEQGIVERRKEVGGYTMAFSNTKHSGWGRPRRLGIYIGFFSGDSDLLEIPPSVQHASFFHLLVPSLLHVLCFIPSWRAMRVPQTCKFVYENS